jgi:hypothetical protein
MVNLNAGLLQELFHDTLMREALYKDAAAVRAGLDGASREAVLVHGMACLTKLRWLPAAHPAVSGLAIERTRRVLVAYLMKEMMGTLRPHELWVAEHAALWFILRLLGPHCKKLLEVTNGGMEGGGGCSCMQTVGRHHPAYLILLGVPSSPLRSLSCVPLPWRSWWWTLEQKVASVSL